MVFQQILRVILCLIKTKLLSHSSSDITKALELFDSLGVFSDDFMDVRDQPEQQVRETLFE